jgi:hypothetical protein
MAKSKQTELDVDFIGGQEPLTKKEQLEISKFFANQRTKRTSKKSIDRKKSIKTTSA